MISTGAYRGRSLMLTSDSLKSHFVTSKVPMIRDTRLLL